MIGTIVIVLVVLAVIVGGVLIYRAHRATIDREAARIAEQAQDLADKAKKKTGKKKVGK